MARLSLFLLGSPRLELDGEPVEINRRKAVALLAYLAVSGQSHSRDALATLLWPEYDQSRARAALRRTLSVLNTSLKGVWLEVDRETIDLKRSADLWVDVAQFQQQVAAHQVTVSPENSSGWRECLAYLGEAVGLYRADLLAGFTLRDSPDFDEWQFFQAESLRRKLAEVLEQLVQGHTAQGDSEPALAYARRWLELDPLHEPVHRYLMELYAQIDQRAAAVRQYQECVRILEEELGVPPSQETTTLYERIRVGDLSGRGGGQQSRLGSVLRQAQKSAQPQRPLEENPGQSAISPPFLSSAAQAPSPPLPFVARERQLAQLNQYLEAALTGQGQTIFVTGDAGSGKTALVREFARRAQENAPELIAAFGNCDAHTGPGDPYLPFREILGLLSGDVERRWLQGDITSEEAKRLWALLPDSTQILLDVGPNLIDTFIPGAMLAMQAETLGVDRRWLERLKAGNGQAEVGQGDLIEQYTQVLQNLAKRHPLLLMVDDAQWADVASINLLFHLSRRLAGSRILVGLVYRPDDVALGRPAPGGRERHPLEPVINEIKRIYGDAQVDLAQVRDRRFVEAFLDTQPNRLGAEFRAALYQRTQGHPLFTVELLRTMQERGDIVPDVQGHWVEGPALNWEVLPGRVEAVIEERINRLDEGLRDLLMVASVEGEAFTAQVVARIRDIPERQLLHQLSQTLEKRHHLVREQGEVQVNGRFLSRYQFTHAMFQQYLYNTLSAGERRLLHGDVAAALEEMYLGRVEEITVQLARHYVQSGQLEKAVDYLLQAGDRARSMYAHQQAIEFYQEALTFLHEQRAYDRAARTLMKLGLTHHLAFNFREARQAYAQGFTLWQRTGINQPAPQPAPHALRVFQSNLLTLDPGQAGDTDSVVIARQLFSGLVELNSELDVVPELAHRWEVLENGSKYIFYLRDDVCWSDGVPLTAEDFVYAWKRVLHPATESPNAGHLYDIKGAKAYHRGYLSDPAQVGVQALNEVMLVIELEGPTSYFPQLLTQSMFFPVPRHVVAVHPDDWTDSAQLVTNGPFELVSWQPGQSLTLERNPRYRGRFTGNLERVEILLDVSFEEGLKLYQENRLDIAHLWSASSPQTERFLQQYPEEYFSGPVLRTHYLGFNTKLAPFKDARVRRALTMAMDREHLASVIFSGYHFPALGGFVPPGMPGHSPSIGLPYHPEQARQLLAEAGYPDGRGFPEIECIIGDDNEAMGEYLEAQWQKNLGLSIKWQTVEWSVLFERVEGNNPNIFAIGWSADYPDPDNFLRVSSYLRGVRWHHPKFSALVEKARRVTNQAERMKIYQEADKLLIEEAALAPLIYGRRHLLIKPWISRFPTSAIDISFWKDVIIEPH